MALWKSYMSYWSEVKSLAGEYDAEIWTVFGGDGTDDNKHSKHGLLTKNISDMISISSATFQPALDLSTKLFYIRGTEAHTGGAGELEELVAKEIGAQEDAHTGRRSRYSMLLNVNKVLQFYAHHPPSTSMRPWTLGGGAMRSSMVLSYDFLLNGDPPPEFAVYGHVHHFEESGKNHPVHVFFSPSWRLTDSYGHRIGLSGRIEAVGGLVFIIKEDATWLWKKVLYTPYRRASYLEYPASSN
jgi:hypothetical protein